MRFSPFQFRLRFLPWLLLLGLIPSLQAVRIAGTEYTDLRVVAAQFGMKAYWVESGKKIRLKSEWTRMDFEVHRRDAEINGIKVHLGDPIFAKSGSLFMSERDIKTTLEPILTPQLFSPVPKLYRIVIDPGHGGKDPGARNTSLSLEERNLALDFSKRLKKKLEALGYAVSLTRENDRFLELADRPAIANRARADLFVSLHFNAASSSKVSGVETFVFTPRYQPSTSRAKAVASDNRDYPGLKNNTWSTLLGYYVQKNLVDLSPYPDRGLKRARFTVLRDLEMPGILVEGGFVSHPREGRDIGSAQYREKLADGITEAILTYQRTLNRLRGR